MMRKETSPLRQREEKMKRALLKDSFKEIKNTYKRFISILLMAFLGVGFFAGMRAASPDMIDVIDRYFDEQNVYDIKVLSTLGLTDEDIEALSQLEGIEKVYGEYSQDILLNFEDTEVVAKVLSIDDVNKVALVEGRMPENSNECLVESAFCKQTKKQIGDTIIIEEDEDSIIKEKEVTIVGTMNSPLYVSRERDTSKLGSGKVSYNMYLPKESFDSEVYTEIYVTLANVKDMQTNSEEYTDCVKTVEEKIEKIKEERQNIRYEEVKSEAQEKLDDAKNKLDEEKKVAEEKLKEAENEIIDGENKLQIAQAELNTKKKEANEQFELAEKQLQEAKAEIQKQENEYPMQEQIANNKISELNKQKEELEANLVTLNNNITLLEIQYEQVVEKLKDTSLTPEQITALELQKAEIEANLETLKIQKESIIGGISEIDAGIKTISEQLQEGKTKLEEAKKTIIAQEAMLNTEKQNANKQFNSAEQKIIDSKEELEEGRKTLEANKAEYEQKIKDAEKELANAENKIEEIKHPTWYILNRSSNSGYNGFIQDTKSIENLGKMFPIVFFVIATLISLTSMTRMVEEQRVQIGTMKALGYNKIQIASKYLLYASLACLIGGSIGMIVGFVTLPRIIWIMYSMMYVIPNFVCAFNVYYAVLGLGLASICIIGATLYTVLNVLVETPAELMRPKAPKPGKRVLLERIPFIWKNLSFTRKVTFRNIFRYKKRFLMTIIGIAGSTALILTGFGIRDSITAILTKQFENVYNYDMQISLKNGLEETEIEEFINKLKAKEEITKTAQTYMTSGTLVNGEKEEDVQIAVPKDEEIEELIHFSDSKTKNKVELQEGKIAITEKVAELLGVKKGDTIVLKDADNKESKVEISDVLENYIYHYVYMPKELYEELYGSYKTNVLFVQDNIQKEQEDTLTKELLNEPNVNTVSLSSSVENVMDDMMKNLNYVVVILIVCAGMLAFVVLYNLSNVNISERIRELATIKVLGFYDKEVYDYVTRETVILTIIGIIFGLLGGYLLSTFILKTCEINVLRFPRVIDPISYIYAMLITTVFTIIVNIVTYFSLKKIDMIESLKSIE